MYLKNDGYSLKVTVFLFIPNKKLFIEPDIHLLMQNIQTLTTTYQKRKLKNLLNSRFLGN
ncbi:hypothetical protein CWC26_15900 [Pseudoalteromonas sp. S4488]|nr:hypothetical protein CWC26_15900 [Pseudoalteromonas sp. S4488]